MRQKLVKLLLISMSVTAVLAVVLAILLNRKPEVISEGTTFADHPATLVDSVVIQNNSGKYQISAKDGGFVLDDVPATLVDVEKFTGLLTYCGEIYAYQTAAVKPRDLAQFGLDNPSATAVISYLDGSGVSLSVGDQEPVSKDYYVSVEGENQNVYLMKADRVTGFLNPKTEYISHLVTPRSGVSSPLSALRDVTFSGGPLPHPVTIESTAGENDDARLRSLSFGTATHIVRSTGIYELDQTYGVEILGSLLGIEAADIAGYNLTDEQIAAYGFDDPYMQVDFELKNAGEVSLFSLKIVPKEEDLFYACLDGQQIVYVIPRLPFMDISYEKLFLRWFLSPLIMDLTGMRVETPTAVYNFLIDATDPKNPSIQLNGSPIETERFRSFYRLAVSAANDGVYLGQVDGLQDQETLLTMTYFYKDAKKEPDVMELKSGATRRVYVSINGNCEFQMKDLFVTRVIEACDKLINGGEIEESW